VAARKKKVAKKAPRKKKRKSYDSDFKQEVVDFAAKHNSRARAARRFRVHASLVSTWMNGGTGRKPILPTKPSRAPTPAPSRPAGKMNMAMPDQAVDIYRNLTEKQECFDTAMADLMVARAAAGIVN